MSLTPSPRLHSASHSRPPSPGKHARDASTFAADARDDSDSKRIKVEPGESEGTGPDGVTAPKLSIDTERAVRPSASGPSHPQSSASLLSTSHAITTPPPHLHSYSASSHSHSRSSPAPHEPTSTSAASARITKSHTPGRDDANAHESDSSAAATPSAGRASAAVSPERKVPKDKSNLHKAAVANKKRKDKPQSKKKTERPENEKPESKDRKRTKSKVSLIIYVLSDASTIRHQRTKRTRPFTAFAKARTRRTTRLSAARCVYTQRACWIDYID